MLVLALAVALVVAIGIHAAAVRWALPRIPGEDGAAVASANLALGGAQTFLGAVVARAVFVLLALEPDNLMLLAILVGFLVSGARREELRARSTVRNAYFLGGVVGLVVAKLLFVPTVGL